MNPFRMLRGLAASVLVAVAASTALAQDYTVTPVTGQYVAPPPTATDIVTLMTQGTSTLIRDDTGYMLTLPFPIAYYGRTYSQVYVQCNGYLLFGGQMGSTYGAAFPYLSGSLYDGMVAACNADLDGKQATAHCFYWTDGVAPNRRLLIAHTNWQKYSAQGGFSYEYQFYESTGRIVFAYVTGGTWSSGTSYNFYVGLDAVTNASTGNDGRYTAPGGGTSYVFTSPAGPANDWQFDPKITNFTGSVAFDRYIVDSSGIGNSSEMNLPLAGVAVELRDGSGNTAATGFTDPIGNFAIKGTALNGSIMNGSLVVAARSVACTVRQSAGGPTAFHTLRQNVSFGADLPIGATVVSEGADPGGVNRAAFNIARTIQGVADWAAARSTDAIPTIDVYYDASSSLPTSYTPGTPGAMRVSSTGASNNDAWDVNILRKFYARHVLGAIAAKPTTGVNSALDAVTDAENAFAEGFGYYVATALSLDTNYRDGTSSSSATNLDLENLTPTSPKGPDVAGWVAAAFADLVDDANEAWDTLDGRGIYLDRPLRTVDSLGPPVTAATFYKAWGDLGYDGVALSSNFVHHGLIPDDADEPNDTAATATVVSQFGFVKKGLVLNLYNEDWYSFTMPQSTNLLSAAMVYDRTAGATVLLELYTSAGALVATGVPQGAFGAIIASSTGSQPAGAYRVRVKHTGGPGIPAYTLQAFAQLAFSSGEFQPWTVGKAYNVPVAVSGGIPPYELTVEEPFVKPPGLVLDGDMARVTGTPTSAGTFNFVLSARDKAEPSNVASGPITFVVNDTLRFQFGEFLAMPVDKNVSLLPRYTGGTAPYTSQITAGTLPHGITIAPGELRYVGRPDIPGSYPFTLNGTDIATSAATGSTTGVVCIPFGTTPIAMGEAASGFYFDAVAGTSVGITVKTSKKRAKRVLDAVLLGPDGSTEMESAAKGGTGKASLAGFVAPDSGRYYFVVSSDVGDASELVASGKVAPPKKGGGAGPPNFVTGKTLEVPVGVLPGAVVTLKATPDKSGLALKAAYLLDPSDTIVSIPAAEVVEKGGSFTVTHTFTTGGTWKIVIGAKPGPQGTFKYSYKIAQPKGAAYSVD